MKNTNIEITKKPSASKASFILQQNTLFSGRGVLVNDWFGH
jgi:hypothetical protein